MYVTWMNSPSLNQNPHSIGHRACRWSTTWATRVATPCAWACQVHCNWAAVGGFKVAQIMFCRLRCQKSRQYDNFAQLGLPFAALGDLLYQYPLHERTFSGDTGETLNLTKARHESRHTKWGHFMTVGNLDTHTLTIAPLVTRAPSSAATELSLCQELRTVSGAVSSCVRFWTTVEIWAPGLLLMQMRSERQRQLRCRLHRPCHQPRLARVVFVCMILPRHSVFADASPMCHRCHPSVSQVVILRLLGRVISLLEFWTAKCWDK